MEAVAAGVPGPDHQPALAEGDAPAVAANEIIEVEARLERFASEVAASVGDPWRAALSGILQELRWAIEVSLTADEMPKSILASVQRLTSTQIEALKREVLPHRPPGSSDAAVFDRKADLIRLLDQQAAGPELRACALDLAWEALRDRDDLTLYCLASGPLDLYYRARRTDSLELRERILSLAGKDSEAGALRMFTGPDGIARLVMEVGRALGDPEQVEAFRRARREAGAAPAARGPAGAEDGDGRGPDTPTLEEEQIVEEFDRLATLVTQLGLGSGPEAGRPSFLRAVK